MEQSKKNQILKFLSEEINYYVCMYEESAKRYDCKAWEVEQLDRYYHYTNGIAVKHDDRAII
jgi:hypothetical protein